MPFDSNGNFTRTQNWTSDFENGIEIVCDRHDNEDDNFANGFNECMLRDGRAPATGNLKMGNFRITGLADGQTSNDAINKGQLDNLDATLRAFLNTTLDALYPVGSVYLGIQETCPLANLISGSKWELVTSSIITDVETSVDVKGTGKTLGLTNGSNKVGLTVQYSADNYYTSVNVTDSAYDTNVRNSNVSGSSKGYLLGSSFGVDTDPAKSGIVGTLTRTQITTNLWKRVA
jgi:hypothetical protein